MHVVDMVIIKISEYDIKELEYQDENISSMCWDAVDHRRYQDYRWYRETRSRETTRYEPTILGS
jgi:hypothetical protein